LWYLPAGAPYAKPRADLNTGSASSNPAELTLYFNEIFFRADDGKSGIELWKIAMPDVANLREETAAVIPPTLLLAPTPQDIPNPSLFPNPSTDYLQVRLPLDNLRLEVWDLGGRLVLPGTTFSQETRLNLQQLLPGQYFLKFYDTNGRFLLSRAFQKSR
jgi:hypothetical protein